MRTVGTFFLLTLLLVACSGDPLPPPRPTVAVVEPVRSEVSLERQGRDVVIGGAERAEQGAAVKTSATGRANAELDNGASILLGQSSEVQLALDQVTLTKGRVWVDTADAEETTVEAPQGTITASGAAFSVALSENGAADVYCGSGELSYRVGSNAGRLQQGERVVLSNSAEPAPEPVALWDDWTGGLADPSSTPAREPAAVGILAGRRLTDRGQARQPIPIRAHDVEVTIRGDLAITRVEQTFFNARSDQLEAEYVLRLPHEAIVTGFAISRGRQDFSEAAVGPLVMAGGQPGWRHDAGAPSALTYDGPDRLRARVYPLNPGETIRIRLTYAEWLDRRGGRRTYVYPMGVEGEPPLLGEFSLDVDLDDAGAAAVRAGMGARVDARRVLLRQSDFRPRADFYLDLLDPPNQGEQGEIARAYVVDAEEGEAGSEEFVLFDIPTTGGENGDQAEERAPLELVLLVDASGGTDLEHLELARSVVEAALRQLAPTDRVALLLADVIGHSPESDETAGQLREASAATRESLLESLARSSLGGATDLARSLSDAAVLVAGRPRGTVLYIGDGVPTTGQLDATSIRRSLGALESPPRFFALGVGEGANIGLLRSLFGDDAHHVLDRTEASRQIMQLLAEASQPTLRAVQAELGPTIERVYPSTTLSLPAGQSLRLVGRVNGVLPETITLRGLRDGAPFEQTLTVETTRGQNNGYIRRRWAAQRFAELLDHDARPELLTSLASRYEIITPWTAMVVGGVRGVPYAPVHGFDRDPATVAWGLGGGSPSTAALEFGARRSSEPARAIESTWSPRVQPGVEPSRSGGNGGIARAAVERALIEGQRAPRLCYERRLLARPELAGELTVRVSVDGGGAVREVSVTNTTLRDRVVERCLAAEVRGLRFPATGVTGAVTASHSYRFTTPQRELGARRECSPSSRKPLRQRRAIWAERLTVQPGLEGAMRVYHAAEQRCELGSWLAQRTILAMMLRHVGDLAQQVRLYQSFGPGSTAAVFIKREILGAVHTPQQMAIVRAGLGLEVAVDWDVFAADWLANPSTEARLGLVRRWLEAVPFDIDLRLRLIRLLEESDNVSEARRQAQTLADDPLCDADARAQLAEFWIRQDEVVEAQRALTGIVERTPLDPWAHRRVGDLCLAFGWGDAAYREYSTLARIRPADPDVTLLLARAAAASGRTDEALRLEQRLSETVSPSTNRGAAAFARLWTAVHLTRLQANAESDAVRAAVARRQRASGVLRDRPVIFAALTWSHPDRRPQLYIRYPNSSDRNAWTRAPHQGGDFGIEAVRVREQEEGSYQLEVRRPEYARDTLEARLLVVTMPGTTDEHIAEVPLTLDEETDKARFVLMPTGDLQPLALEG